MTVVGALRYWRAALFAPGIGALGGYFFGGFGLFFTTAFLIVAVPYVAFVIVMWWWLGRLQTLRAMWLLALAAPLVFLPFAVAYAFGLAIFEVFGLSLPELNETLGLLPFVLSVGYAYAVGLLLLFALAVGFLSRSNRERVRKFSL